MGYETRLLIGEVYGRGVIGTDSDPAPIWMNPVLTMDLSKMGHDSAFAEVRSKAKAAGVFVYRHARFSDDETEALKMAIQVIQEHAPPGSFQLEVPWWKQLRGMPQDGGVEHREHLDPYGSPFRRLSFRETAAACRKMFEEGERGGNQGYRRALLAAVTLEHFVEAIAEGRWREYDPLKHGTSPRGELMLIHEGY